MYFYFAEYRFHLISHKQETPIFLQRRANPRRHTSYLAILLSRSPPPQIVANNEIIIKITMSMLL